MTVTNTIFNGADTAERLGLAQLYAKRIAPTTGWPDMGLSEHFVQFYDSDDFIVNSIAEYIIHGLKSDDICIVAATRHHVADVERVVESYTDGLETARLEGRYIVLDAAETLEKLIVNNRPDANLFSAVIGETIEKAARTGRNIRVFGELVGVLCAEQNYSAAVELEEFWNELRERYPFSLFCAYPIEKLGNNVTHMANICSEHSRVIPTESYTSLTSADERLREIAILQQRSRQLEAEVRELECRIAIKETGLAVA